MSEHFDDAIVGLRALDALQELATRDQKIAKLEEEHSMPHDKTGKLIERGDTVLATVYVKAEREVTVEEIWSEESTATCNLACRDADGNPHTLTAGETILVRKAGE